MNTLLPGRIEAVTHTRAADELTLRMCLSELDAVLTSIRLSRLPYRILADRAGVSLSMIGKWAGGATVSSKREMAFCNATGTLLLKQFRSLERAKREAAGVSRRSDRIAAIAAPTERAWRAA